MSKRYQLLAIGVGVVLVGAVGIALISTPQSIQAKTQTATSANALSAPPAVSNAEPSGYEHEVESYIQVLTKLESAKTSRDLAASKTEESRRFLASAYRSHWSNLLSTSWGAFMELRRQAGRTPTRQTPCTLCDGKGFENFCILCPERVGKCVTCQGLGRTTAEQICPTCLGNGKCYLCYGSGKMLCPFCNNGIVEFRRPLPSNNMPTD